ncbi:MAG: TIGR01841 family phasin [Gammaproteobacteria bacterium]|nr:TIGR01841 family phasin [Gammaproteobacteria bacterium]
MTNVQSIQTFVDAAQEAMAPMSKYNDFAAKAMERVLRKQWEVAGACFELGIEELHAIAKMKDVQGTMSTQQDIIARMTDTLTRGSTELMEIVRENQAEAIDLFTKQAQEAGDKVSKATKAAQKAA